MQDNLADVPQNMIGLICIQGSLPLGLAAMALSFVGSHGEN